MNCGIKMNTLFIAVLLIGTISYSPSTKVSLMKNQKNTYQEISTCSQTNRLIYEKIVHFTAKGSKR